MIEQEDVAFDYVCYLVLVTEGQPFQLFNLIIQHIYTA